MNSKWSYSLEPPNFCKNRRFFFSCVALKFDRWPWKTIGHLFYATSNFVHHFRAISKSKLKLQSGNALFHSHQWILPGVTVRKRPIWVKIDDFFSHVTLKFDGWPRKTIGHLFYVVSSFVLHLIAISEFCLELQSGSAKYGSKSTIFFTRVTLKFYGWPWKTIGHLFYATSSSVHHLLAIGEF